MDSSAAKDVYFLRQFKSSNLRGHLEPLFLCLALKFAYIMLCVPIRDHCVIDT